jgi:hypothetical protein
MKTMQDIAGIKSMYPKGTRIQLIHMSDPWHPIETGTKGTVRLVDDMGTIHVNWDNGRSLGLIVGEDSFEVLKGEAK